MHDLASILDATTRMVMVDCDGNNSADVLQELGLEPANTLSYNSRRGPHLFYKWPAGLTYPPRSLQLEQGDGRDVEFKVNSLTAMPPQTHPSGTEYTWYPGSPPSAISDAPEALVQRVSNAIAAYAEAQAKQRGKDSAGWGRTLQDVVDGGHLEELDRVRFAGAWTHGGTRTMFCLFPEDHRGGERERPSAYLSRAMVLGSGASTSDITYRSLIC